MQCLSKSFFQGDDVVQIARALLGKSIITTFDNQFTIGKIVETEAYNGSFDKACHAYLNRNTKRTSVMFESGGIAYVYLCYGIHHLFNIVTNKKGIPDAVLIRAVEPVEGIEIMQERREMQHAKPALTNGPGKLSQALGLKTKHTGMSVLKSPIQIVENELIDGASIQSAKRIGIEYAASHASLPWRFYLKNNDFVSKT